MAAQIFTINPEAFTEALKELPLSAVYAKVSELRNSIAHLHRSNAEMKDFLEASQSDEERREMEGYIRENEGVFASMRERLDMLRTEVERRGQSWIEEEGDGSKEEEKEGGDGVPATNGALNSSSNAAGQPGGDAEEGVYL
ncbi:hypothetical protein N7481_002702 [Penicillium waksmanii]|uniref:uncharacterized protein n=1 Tax=Penicillium waksmanii TaxID=69791 RepID=UPI002546B26A|nr:uncharacterized protein N7481_002702 [Penicillium waksmanii]KAJ5995725.1 hypothetical protein N7481_002702 [Penicillium waksmanii]